MPTQRPAWLLGIALFLSATAPSFAAANSSPRPQDWWSFQPVQDPAPPVVKNQTWPVTDIDRFILAKLESNGMTPPPPADKRTLLRRATFDLIGLPPTPAEIDDFLNDASPDAFRKVVDRLLASNHYGERWGRHWLDVARYADTSGDNGDFPMPEAWRYRNYVINSFNRDKPYNQFLREQLAGDLLPSESDEQRFEQIVATGFLAISRRFSSLGEEFHLTLDDTIDNVGKALLGLTVSCARCHEHKFDPIPQEDYYALYGIFNSSRYAFPGTEIYRHTQDTTPLVSDAALMATLKPKLDKMAELDAEIFRIYSKQAELDTGKEKNDLKAVWKKLQKERDELVKGLPKYDRAYGVGEGSPANERLHIKGEREKLGAEVPRGFLTVLGGQKTPPGKTGSGRRQLAEWIASPANPLTARVMANRIWLHHFGAGLVRTPDDVGVRGGHPTHPELLDYLTTRFITGGWSVKSMHRLIMLSAAYQTACIENDACAERDAENSLLWSFHRRRLSAEEIRDAMLKISGELDISMGGAHPFKNEWDWRYSQHNPFVDDFPTRRRSVYLMQQRIRQQPFLATFDGADSNATTGKRGSSTTPQQALFMMNNTFTHERAATFAARALATGADPDARLDYAFANIHGRPPAPEEKREARDFIAQFKADADADDNAAWAAFIRVLFSGNEFMFVE